MRHHEQIIAALYPSPGSFSITILGTAFPTTFTRTTMPATATATVMEEGDDDDDNDEYYIAT